MTMAAISTMQFEQRFTLEKVLKIFNFKRLYKPNHKFMFRSSHIQGVLIGVELWMFTYFLLFGWGKFNQKRLTYL